MRVVAVLAVRNERPYLSNCLSHLVENGIDFAIVDNDSVDGCAELIHDRRFAPHLAGYRRVPFTGAFLDRKSTRLNSSHIQKSRMPSSA